MCVKLTDILYKHIYNSLKPLMPFLQTLHLWLTFQSEVPPEVNGCGAFWQAV